MGCEQSMLVYQGDVNRTTRQDENDESEDLVVQVQCTKLFHHRKPRRSQHLVNDVRTTKSSRHKGEEYWKDFLDWEPEKVTKSQEESQNAQDKKLLYERIFHGDVKVSLPLEKKSIRIFLSSTFNDYANERNFILKNTLPYLKRFASKFGIEIIISEMRWGISDIAVKENKTIEICLNEIDNCRDQSIGPFFCAFLGDRYGYCPPPPQLTIESYNDAVNKAKKDGKTKEFEALSQSYHLDSNFDPPVYILSYPNNKKRPSLSDKSVSLTSTQDDESYFEQLLSSFFESISVTEREISHGFLDTFDENLDALGKRIAVFHRHLENIGDMSSSIFCDENGGKLEQLKQKTKRFAMEHNSTFHHYDVKSLDDIHMEPYLLEFANDFCLWVIKGIQQHVSSNSSIFSHDTEGDKMQTTLLREISAHHNQVNRIFVGREEIVETLLNFCIEGKGAMVLRGASGTGKTSVMAQVANKVSEKMSISRKHVVLLRFLGTTPSTSTSEAVVASMLMQLTAALPSIAAEVLDLDDSSISNSPDRFLQLVRALASRGYKICIILDSLDQIDSSDPWRSSYDKWLPPLFGPGVLDNITILLSALPDHLGTIEKMKFHNIVDLPIFTSREGEKMIESLCQSKSRRLEQHQLEKILDNFEHEKSAMFLKICFEQSLHWNSWQENIEVPSTVDGQISLLFQQLNNDFGEKLVRSFISHMTIARGGLSLQEIQHIVSLDSDVLKEVFKWHSTPDGLVPPLLIANVVNRLDPYLVKRKVDDVSTIYWYHRQFWQKGASSYLSDKKWVHKIQSQAIKFYSMEPTYHEDKTVNARKMRQLPLRLLQIEDWSALHNFLIHEHEALLIELTSKPGQSRYASFWRKLRENSDLDISIESTLVSFCKELRLSFEQIVQIGDFLKEYFNAYDAALKIYKLISYTSSISESQKFDVMSRIGDVYTRLSDYNEGHNWLSQSYDGLKRLHGESHDSTLRVLILLSRLMKDWGRYKQSLEYDTMLYEISTTKYGNGDERIADAARQLARTHYLSGRYNIAIDYYSQSLTIRKILYGDEHPQTAIALNCMGMANKVLGNFREGIKYCKQAYEVKLALYGKMHSDTAVTIDNLGSLYHLDGQFEKAMDLYRDAWDIKKQTLGEHHADTIMMYGQIGRLHHDMGDLEQARSLLEDNLKFRLELLDSDHPQIAVAKNPLAALLIDLKEYEEAKKLAKESVALRLEVLSEEHPYIGFAYDTLALAELGLGDLVAAEYNAKISLERRIKFLGKDHFRSAVGHMTLAKIFSAQNRRKEAIDEAQKANDLYMAVLRNGHPFQKKAAALLEDLKKSTLEGSEMCR